MKLSPVTGHAIFGYKNKSKNKIAANTSTNLNSQYNNISNSLQISFKGIENLSDFTPTQITEGFNALKVLTEANGKAPEELISICAKYAPLRYNKSLQENFPKIISELDIAYMYRPHKIRNLTDLLCEILEIYAKDESLQNSCVKDNLGELLCYPIKLDYNFHKQIVGMEIIKLYLQDPSLNQSKKFSDALPDIFRNDNCIGQHLLDIKSYHAQNAQTKNPQAIENLLGKMDGTVITYILRLNYKPSTYQGD